ncbi:hypothetical protein TWF703_009560 [Orbilia oligospora]|uniref:Uncharacterized protein n=1 Tax=Orbilia oligospora TaxID=2813651 RepID=A0A7C8NPP8_ORBOL|nr:hypothetical protein TWF703_009560 [Orbilia oligospora]
MKSFAVILMAIPAMFAVTAPSTAHPHPSLTPAGVSARRTAMLPMLATTAAIILAAHATRGRGFNPEILFQEGAPRLSHSAIKWDLGMEGDSILFA